MAKPKKSTRSTTPPVAVTPDPKPKQPVRKDDCQAEHVGYAACQCGGPLCGGNVTS